MDHYAQRETKNSRGTYGMLFVAFLDFNRNITPIAFRMRFSLGVEKY
jgi:hypothetical protein